MKQTFITKNFTESSLSIITLANSIIDEYSAQGYQLTLRQLYYQFVAKDWLPNSQQSYNRLGSIITDARLAGFVDWRAIEDRTRSVNSWITNEDPETALEDIEYKIGGEYWKDQGIYIEVWIEKEALADVIMRPCAELSVPYLACKGYLSASEAYRAGKRFERALSEGRKGVLIHLGDHDPSGIDMTRDNAERLKMFSSDTFGDIKVERIALNMDQIEEYAPPPNPAKVTDSRAKEYIDNYGRASWELDALEPRILTSLVTDAIDEYRDLATWHETERRVEEIKERLICLRENWLDVNDFLVNL